MNVMKESPRPLTKGVTMAYLEENGGLEFVLLFIDLLWFCLPTSSLILDSFIAGPIFLLRFKLPVQLKISSVSFCHNIRFSYC